MRNYSSMIALAVLAVSLLLLPGCLIQTQQGQKIDVQVAELQQRVANLEKQNQELRTRFDDSSRFAGEAVIGFQQMQNEVAVLQGRFDEVAHNSDMSREQVETLRRQMAAEFNNISRRLEVVEKQLGITPASIGSTGEPQTMEADEVLQKAMALFNQGNLESAKAHFNDFLARFKKHEKRDQAQFYLAECFFKQRNWEESILAYDTMVNTYPKSKLAPVAYLHMGIAFAENGQISEARLFFQKVVSAYPGTNEAEIAKKKLKMMQ